MDDDTCYLFDENDIFKCISDLPDTMVMDPDNVLNRFIKNCNASITKPILILLKESLRNGVVPQKRKIKADLFSFQNYRKYLRLINIFIIRSYSKIPN